MKTKHRNNRSQNRRKGKTADRREPQATVSVGSPVSRPQEKMGPTSGEGWRTLVDFHFKGLSLTLGLPAGIVLTMLVLVHADWGTISAHINIPTLLGGSISTVLLGALRKTWKR
jgi:hypothetical protein